MISWGAVALQSFVSLRVNGITSVHQTELTVLQNVLSDDG